MNNIVLGEATETKREDEQGTENRERDLLKRKTLSPGEEYRL